MAPVPGTLGAALDNTERSLLFVMFCQQERKFKSHHLCSLFFHLVFVALPEFASCFNTKQGLLAFAVNSKDTAQTGRGRVGGHDLLHSVAFSIRKRLLIGLQKQLWGGAAFRGVHMGGFEGED